MGYPITGQDDAMWREMNDLAEIKERIEDDGTTKEELLEYINELMDEIPER